MRQIIYCLLLVPILMLASAEQLALAQSESPAWLMEELVVDVDEDVATRSMEKRTEEEEIIAQHFNQLNAKNNPGAEDCVFTGPHPVLDEFPLTETK